MHRFRFFVTVILFCLVLSCFRSGKGESAASPAVLQTPTQPAALTLAVPSSRPMAVLQAGELPLWFRVTPDGPVLIETIEDAVFSAALIPWPLAPHIRFVLAPDEELLMAVNDSGLIRLSPETGTKESSGVGLYYVSGGEFWRQYTVGAFFLFGEKPAVLLYRDDRFLDSDAPLPVPHVWTYPLFGAAKAEAVTVPALNVFTPEDGWNTDILHLSGDFWYFRTVNRTTARPEIMMFRTEDLSHAGGQISLGLFQSAARPEPLTAASAPLRDMLAALFAETGGGAVSVVSPEFPSTRRFAGNRENGQTFFGFYSNNRLDPRSLMITDPRGAGFYVQAETKSVRRFSLPPLPEGFAYTGIALTKDTVFTSWEEQDGYSIGAAGFMALLLSALTD